ncbi:unnamed protein product, partial [Mesorhabditis belari]|uniref:Transducin beta-like protein 2 n=1 Tax=Mesorhabditis belari TaxID=2138241 RepID=A0AAF3F7C8_9BILA
MDPNILLGIFVAVTIFVVSILFLTRKTGKSIKEEKNETIKEVKPNLPQQIKSKKEKTWGNKKEAGLYAHSWSLTTLKGHTGPVLDVDFASDGKKFASISDDGTMILWHIKDFEEKEHKFSRNPLEFDRMTLVSFGPDSKSLLVAMKRENKLGVYTIQKREDTGTKRLTKVESVDFPKVHTQNITQIGFASNGKFVFSACAEGKVVIYSLRGDILERLEPKIGGFYDAVLSRDGRFLAITGFSPEAFVYEIKFTAKGEFVSAKKAFNLQGARSGIHSVSFNQDSSRAVTVSKDGYWRVYNTDIRFSQGEDAKEIASGEWLELKGAKKVHLDMSPSGGSFAMAIGKTLKISTIDEDFEPMLDVQEEPITRVQISPNGQMVATSGSKFIRLFHNVPESYAEIHRLKKSLTGHTTDAQRRRITESIDDIKEDLRKKLKE